MTWTPHSRPATKPSRSISYSWSTMLPRERYNIDLDGDGELHGATYTLRLTGKVAIQIRAPKNSV